MSKQTFTFGGVFIPAKVWLDSRLTSLDKLVWAVVAYMHDGSRICYASDQEIADSLGSEYELAVSGSLLRLTTYGIVSTTVDADGRRLLWASDIEFVEKEVEPEAQADIEDVKSIIELYNAECKTLPRAEKLTAQRIRRLRVLLADWNHDRFKRLFSRVHCSDFLSGRSGKWTGCNFDWVLTNSNLVKIEEGVYDNKGAALAPTKLPENLR